MIAQNRDKLTEVFLAQLSSRGELRSFDCGEILIKEGEQSDSLYILVSGELKVFTRDESGRELVYNVLQPGEFFGEMFLDGGPRSASVRSASQSTCVVVCPIEFRQFLHTYPEFAEVLVLKLISRVRHATEKLRDMAMKDVYQRVTALLNELAVGAGDERVIDKSITQQEIANRIGATREMVNHIIRGLARGGFLARDRDRGMVLAKDLPKHW